MSRPALVCPYVSCRSAEAVVVTADVQSSAAFVVASVIMFLAANGITGLTKGDVVKLAIASEHRMGLRTGGMDVSQMCACRRD